MFQKKKKNSRQNNITVNRRLFFFFHRLRAERKKYISFDVVVKRFSGTDETDGLTTSTHGLTHK